MTPVIYEGGHSFMGAAKYLLNDIGSSTSSKRVEFVDTYNLFMRDKSDGKKAARVMAATAMSARDLKKHAWEREQAALPEDHPDKGKKFIDRGRKGKPVMHFSLNWHPDQKGQVTQEEMTSAAHSAIRALGATDRQAVITAHSDKKQPHVHILLNRVSPEDGKMLKSSYERRNLSRWAEKYEKQRGRVYCKQRVINNQERKKISEYNRTVESKEDKKPIIRHPKRKPRQIFEMERDAKLELSAKDQSKLENTVQKQRQKDFKCKDETNGFHRTVEPGKSKKVDTRPHILQRKKWSDLKQTHKDRLNALKTKHEKEIASLPSKKETSDWYNKRIARIKEASKSTKNLKVKQVQGKFERQEQELHLEQDASLTRFKLDQEKLSSNLRIRIDAFKQGFNPLSSRGYYLENFKAQQKQELKQFQDKKHQAIENVIKDTSNRRLNLIECVETRYTRKRSALVGKQRNEKSAEIAVQRQEKRKTIEKFKQQRQDKPKQWAQRHQERKTTYQKAIARIKDFSKTVQEITEKQISKLRNKQEPGSANDTQKTRTPAIDKKALTKTTSEKEKPNLTQIEQNQKTAKQFKEGFNRNSTGSGFRRSKGRDGRGERDR